MTEIRKERERECRLLPGKTLILWGPFLLSVSDDGGDCGSGFVLE